MGRFLRFVALLIAILALFPLYTRYKAEAGPIAPGVHLAGMEMSHLKDPAEINRLLQERHRDPLAVYFGETRLALRPDEIGFEVDGLRMVEEAERYLNGPEFFEIAVRHLLGLEQKRYDVPLYYTYDAEQLTAWLTEVADTLNRPPQPARALPPRWEWANGGGENLPSSFVGTIQEDWSWALGSAGLSLRFEESAERILTGFIMPEQGSVELALDETVPPSPSLDDLARALDTLTADFPGFAAIYVQDIASGEEGMVDVDVAFSGMSTLKIAIVTTAFSRIGEIDDAGLGQLMDYALGESSNDAANLLLERIGGGSRAGGAVEVTALMNELGFENTFMLTGYEEFTPQAPPRTPANQQTEWNTNPDSNLQTTPADMGRLLAMIYRCAQGEGPLIHDLDQPLTMEECRTILFYMSHDEFTELIWGGLPRPDESWILHKHGFVNEAHSDVALVWGPTGPYVVSVFLWRSGWMDWDTSNGTMREISRIVWNFFDFRAGLQEVGSGEELVLEPPPNYRPINTYSSRAATLFQTQ